MTCEDLLQYLSDYIDGELDVALVEAAKRHLSTCKNCRIVLDSTQRAIVFYKDQPDSLPEIRKTALFDKISAAFKKKM